MLCKYIYSKWAFEDGDMQDVKKIVNVDAVSWYLSWIPLLNVYLTVIFLRDSFHGWCIVMRLRKIIDPLHKAHPEDESITNVYNIIHFIKK